MKNDTAYAVGAFIPDADACIERWEEDAREFREIESAVGRARLNTPYGPDERNRFDLFYPSGRPEGLVVFVHGGYWRLFDRSYWSHFAAGCTARDWAVAVPSYVLAPDAGIPEISRQIADAIEAAAQLVQGPIRLTGHSAGGHVVSRMLNPDTALAPEIQRRLARVLPISPLSDLRPLIETTMNVDLGLDDAGAVNESPSLHPKALNVPVTVWVGAEERPAFLDQAHWLAEAWNATHRIAPGRHHFDVIDELKDADSPLVNALLA